MIQDDNNTSITINAYIDESIDLIDTYIDMHAQLTRDQLLTDKCIIRYHSLFYFDPLKYVYSNALIISIWNQQINSINWKPNGITIYYLVVVWDKAVK